MLKTVYKNYVIEKTEVFDLLRFYANWACLLIMPCTSFLYTKSYINDTM